MQCVERGLLSLDEPVGRILPELQSPDILTGFDDSGQPLLKKATKPITLRHLLTHSSGLGYAFINPLLTQYSQWKGNAPSVPQTSIKHDFLLPLTFEPGDGWDYSCSIDWAGQMVERVNGGITLGEYMNKNIFEPLAGLKSTTFRPSQDPGLQARMCGRPLRGPDGTLVPATPDLGLFPTRDPDDDYGGSGLYSCAEDYIKVISALLIDDGKLLKPETVKELFRPQLPDPKYFMAVLSVPAAAQVLIPNMVQGVEWNYALGGCVAVNGIEGRGGKGLMFWSGLPNSFWVSSSSFHFSGQHGPNATKYVDRERGVCGFYAGQLFPPGDLPTQALFAQFQAAIFAQAKP